MLRKGRKLPHFCTKFQDPRQIILEDFKLWDGSHVPSPQTRKTKTSSTVGLNQHANFPKPKQSHIWHRVEEFLSLKN